jgi:4-hydroxythreonine-4-phosphate dehydrogenase
VAKPLLVITPGDPLGIGPEVVCRALTRRPELAPLLVGDAAAIRAQAEQVGLKLVQVDDPIEGSGPRIYEPADLVEPVEVASLRCAVELIQRGQGAGLVTGPINKEKLVRQGFSHRGHTEFLGELCGVSRPVMAFVGGPVRVALVTTHIPLAHIATSLSIEGVFRTIQVAHEALQRDLSIAVPRIAVCGLNPHAGDGGVIGSEEIELIAPAVKRARDAGIDACGPMSAETVFRKALTGEYDMVVAMYHDQGLVPLKALGFGDSVNWTLGLPLIRTSVDHGTAYDIAGRSKAEPSSMLAALDWAQTLVSSRE